MSSDRQMTLTFRKSMLQYSVCNNNTSCMMSLVCSRMERLSHNFQARSGVSGGPYMCVHLRRKDFLWGRPKQVPSIAGAARQIRAHLEQLELTTVFVATDSPLKGNFIIAVLCLKLVEPCYRLLLACILNMKIGLLWSLLIPLNLKCLY
jgi:hypothetical protein